MYSGKSDVEYKKALARVKKLERELQILKREVKKVRKRKFIFYINGGLTDTYYSFYNYRYLLVVHY
jgi:hypothetical protein